MKVIATHLRLGNIVMSKINGISKVEQLGTSLNPNYVGGRSLDGRYWENNSYLPVEITEQWLIDFGFVKNDVIYHKNKFSIFLKNNDAVGCVYYNMTYLKKQPDYVHELQNLFFAIEGLELI